MTVWPREILNRTAARAAVFMPGAGPPACMIAIRLRSASSPPSVLVRAGSLSSVKMASISTKERPLILMASL